MNVLWVLAAALLALLGCSKQPSTDDASRYPMILFGVDGLEWDVMNPLLDDGKLPNIARLMERGTFGYLASMRPTYSPVIWTSIATGKVPQDHGIRGYVYKTKRQGRIESRYYTSGHRGTKAFWNILGDYGLRVHCIGWWITYPAEPINGVMISQTNTTAVLHKPQQALWKGTLLKGVEGQVHPVAYQNRVMDILDTVDKELDQITGDIFGERPHPPDEFSQIMWDQTLWAFRADATYVRVAKDILASEEPFDLLAIYIGGTDVAAHRFWRYAHPEEFNVPPDPTQIENFGDLIDDYYLYVDRCIGEIMKLAPEETAVMVVSDHGMHATNNERAFSALDTPQEMNSGHHEDGPPGVFIAAGGPFRSPTDPSQRRRMVTVGGVMDVTPTLLAIKGVPAGEDMYGKAMTGIVRPDWIHRVSGTSVSTHDTEDWLNAHKERIREAVNQTERLEQLRSLGYIR